MNTERAKVGWGFWLWWVLVSTVALLLVLVARKTAGEALDISVDPAGVWIVVWIVAGAAVGIAQWFVLRRQVSRAGWWVLASAVGVALGFVTIFALGGADFTAVVRVDASAVGKEVALGRAVEEALGRAVVSAMGGEEVSAVKEAVLDVMADAVEDGEEPLASAVEEAVVSSVEGFVEEVVEEALASVEGLAVLGVAVGIAQWFILRRRVSQAGWWALASTVGFAVSRAVTLAAPGGLEGIFAWILGLALYGAITGGVLVWLLRQSVPKEPSLPIAAT